MPVGVPPIEGSIRDDHLPFRSCQPRGLTKPTSICLDPPIASIGPRFSPIGASSVVDPAAGSRPLPAVVDGEAVYFDRVDEEMRLASPVPGAESVAKILGPKNITGTGFLIGPDLLMTSRHVVVDIGDVVGTRVAFGWEFGHDLATVVNVAEPTIATGPDGGLAVEFEDLDLDVAILRLTSTPAEATVVTLGRPPADGSVVTVVGYPNEAGDENVSDAAAIILLGGPALLGRKRASPGLLRSSTRSELHHDCSTMPGSSGSPLIDPATGAVVGLHRGRVPDSILPRNLALPMPAIVEILPPDIRRLVTTDLPEPTDPNEGKNCR